mmetsp:Transcript_115415/g.359487  ORF Transcript_115415/g.359487 Transcript_115415/m.359487 type:complete len:237 (-) Transcript_115415:44-754(-)
MPGQNPNCCPSVKSRNSPKRTPPKRTCPVSDSPSYMGMTEQAAPNFSAMFIKWICPTAKMTKRKVNAKNPKSWRSSDLMEMELMTSMDMLLEQRAAYHAQMADVATWRSTRSLPGASSERDQRSAKRPAHAAWMITEYVVKKARVSEPTVSMRYLSGLGPKMTTRVQPSTSSKLYHPARGGIFSPRMKGAKANATRMFQLWRQARMLCGARPSAHQQATCPAAQTRPPNTHRHFMK